MKVCRSCEEEFTPNSNAQVFCTRDCRVNRFKQRSRKHEKICPTCTTTFHGYYEEQMYCSRKCWLNAYNVVNPDGHNERGAKAGGEANKKLRGTSHGGNAYVKEDQRHQHRVVAERELGRPLTKDEVVHHVDENRKNNDPLNLYVFPSQSEHFRHHGHLKAGGECKCSFTHFKK